MANTFFGLTIGTTGIYASMAGINTTSHNISNEETEGYSRQVVNRAAANALRVNGTHGMVGTGVEVLGVEQERDAYYDLKYRTNNTSSGEYSTKSYYMTEVENYFNEVKLEGFTTTFNSMYDALQEMSKNPANLTVRTQCTSYAQSMCEYFNSLYNSIQQIQEECNTEIRNQVERINAIAQELAMVNKQIVTIEVNGGVANDLRDQRNLLLDELSGYGSISVEERVVGDDVGVNSFTVKMDSQLLVDTYEFNTLSCIPRSEKVNRTDVVNLYDIEWQDGSTFDPLSPTLGGTLTALFQMRDGNNGEGFTGTVTAPDGETMLTVTDTSINSIDRLTIDTTGVLQIGNREYTYDGFQVKTDANGKYVYEFSLKTPLTVAVDEEDIKIGENISYKGIPYYMSQLSQFTRTFAKEFNDLHKAGVDLEGNQGLDFFNGSDVVTGENYVFETSPEDLANGVIISSKSGQFETDDAINYGSYYFMHAGNFSVTKAVYEDSSKVVTASEITNGVEQSNVINELIKLKSDASMFNQGDPAAFLQTLVAEVGIDTSKTINFAKNQINILKSVTNQRLSISGVDADEEAMNLVRFQNSYNLSAKVISILNEIYNKLINDMGV